MNALLKKISVFLFPLLVLACQPMEERNETNPADSAQSSGPKKQREYNPYEDCPRGPIKPALSLEAFPKRRFQVISDGYKAFETVTFRGGDSLVIVHSGCQYEVTSFNYYAKSKPGELGQLRMTRKAVQVVHQIVDGLEEPMVFRAGAEILSRELSKGTLKTGKEYRIEAEGESPRRQTVVLKEVRQVPGRLLVRVEFTCDP